MTKKWFFLIGLLVLPAYASNYASPISTKNREQLQEYYTSGNYFNEIEKKLSEAKEYLDRQIQYPRPNPLAIIFDIDETVLSNYRDLERLRFTYHPQALTGAHMLSHAEPILPVLAFYQYAINQKIAIFFISERPNTPEIMEATVKNLKSAGFDKWEEILLRPLDQNHVSVQNFKTNARRHIAVKGFDIVLNVGDQTADVTGGYAEIKVKLPNPFYEIA